MRIWHYNMRLLHIIGSMDPKSGGPCQGIRSSSPILENLGVYREIVCFDDPASDYLGKDPFPVHALGTEYNQWGYSSKLKPWLRENLQRFDVVITNGLWMYHSHSTWQVLKWYRKRQTGVRQIRWFVMPHGMLDPYFQRAASRKLKAVRNWVYWLLMERDVIRQANGILFTCETELLLARQTFRYYKPQREINVGYGIENPPSYTVDMNEAFHKSCPLLSKRPYLLFLSRINYKKGIDFLIKAYSNLLKEYPNTVHIPQLVIAGPGVEDQYGKQMQQLVAKISGLDTHIFFPGMLMGDAKWGALYGCEAFVLPSHQENFGVAVAEAMACGKPVLVSNQVNIWREIEAGNCGLIADDTLAGTEHLLRQWLKLTPNAQEEMGKRAQTTFEQHFTVELAALQFKEAISQ